MPVVHGVEPELVRLGREPAVQSLTPHEEGDAVGVENLLAGCPEKRAPGRVSRSQDNRSQYGRYASRPHGSASPFP